MRKTCHIKSKHKWVGVGILISGKMDFRTKIIIRDRDIYTGRRGNSAGKQSQLCILLTKRATKHPAEIDRVREKEKIHNCSRRLTSLNN
jgi:hypothetical protein